MHNDANISYYKFSILILLHNFTKIHYCKSMHKFDPQWDNYVKTKTCTINLHCIQNFYMMQCILCARKCVLNGIKNYWQCTLNCFRELFKTHAVPMQYIFVKYFAVLHIFYLFIIRDLYTQTKSIKYVLFVFKHSNTVSPIIKMTH